MAACNKENHFQTNVYALRPNLTSMKTALSFFMRSVDMQTRQQRVGLIAQNTPMPNIFESISSGTCAWAQKDVVSSVLMLPPFSALFVRLQNIILVYESIVKNLCMDLELSQVLSYFTNIAIHSHNTTFSLSSLNNPYNRILFLSTTDLKKVRRFYFCIYFPPGGAQFHHLELNRYNHVNPAQGLLIPFHIDFERRCLKHQLENKGD